jgi:formylglycine-generating enzyme required for sulfatase activity
MSDEFSSIQAQLAKLRRKLVNLESLRDVLGDETLEQAKSELEARIHTLMEPAGDVLAQGDVTVEGGDSVEWAQYIFTAQGERAIVIGGDATGVIAITGSGNRVYLPPDQLPLEELTEAYLRSLAAECRRLPLGVVDPRFIETGVETSIPLPEVYVDLDVMAPVREEWEEGEFILLGGLGQEEGGGRIPLLEAITLSQVTHFVLLGDPGAGKTTCVNYLAYALAAEIVEAQHVVSLRGMFPIRLTLREVAARCIPPGTPEGQASMLWEALRADLSVRLGEKAADVLFPHLQSRLLKEGGLVLLDGLDEVPEAGRRRERLLEAIADFTAALPPAHSRVVVTARPYAYVDPRWHLPGFETLSLAPFNRKQIERFIARWYQVVRPTMGWDEATAWGRGERLLGALSERPYLADLATRPLLLTLMATLHTSWGQLPEDLADLHEESVKLLLSRWQRAREVKGAGRETVVEPGIARALAVEEGRIRAALHWLAYEAHRQQGERVKREEVPADIGETEVLAAFAPFLPDDFNPRVLLGYLETRAGLLVARGPGIYAFPHRSFQEYLAVCHLADQPGFAVELRNHVWDDPTWWREVYLLGVGRAKRSGLDNAVHVVNTLVPRGPKAVEDITETHWQAAVLAGRALIDLHLAENAEGQPYFETVMWCIRSWLVQLVERGTLKARERARAGRVLGLLGDPRDFDLFVEIPGGHFLIGAPEDDKEAYANEHPQHELFLPTFWFGRYPVTNSQYARFVEAGGYNDERWWDEVGWAWRQGANPDFSSVGDDRLREFWEFNVLARPVERRHEPFHWRDPNWNVPNYPVVGINWYEACAYCRWLTSELRMSSNKLECKVWRDGLVEPLTVDFKTYKVRLPNEVEWEKAAGWDTEAGWKQRYSWGDEWRPERANVDNNVGATSAEGIFPAGQAASDALDCTGNVWEWTLSSWGSLDYNNPKFEYPYDADDGRESLDAPGARVLRGGGWTTSRRNARVSYRGSNPPANYRVHVGMRVVVAPVSK